MAGKVDVKNSGDLRAAIVATGMAPAFLWWGCPRSTMMPLGIIAGGMSCVFPSRSIFLTLEQ